MDELKKEASEAPDTDTGDLPRSDAKEVTHADAMKRWDRAWLKERENIQAAYLDQELSAGNQWDDILRKSREDDSRPCLTYNRLGQFRRQVTGDLRKLDPDIKTVAVGGKATEKIAEIRGGMRRHIQNRCDAHEFIYAAAADSMVGCGIGHVEVFSEYSPYSKSRQELGVRLIDDQIAVLWDTDARHPTRSDAMWCFTYVELSREAYEDTYPDHAVSDIGTSALTAAWFYGDTVRIARYWYKVEAEVRMMEMPDGGFENIDEATESDISRMKDEGGEIVKRKTYKVMSRMMNGTEFLTKPEESPGPFIPVVPFIGEEIRIGTRIFRHGIIRFAIDAQRAHNYYESAQAEVIGLQPRSPFIATVRNTKDNQNEWDTCNVKNFATLNYTPDPANSGAPPSRSQPPMSSAGIAEASASALQAMQAVTGIYNASLGARSNEISGAAIKQREQQGDTGTYVYVKNYELSLKHIARIIDSKIPFIYDTAQITRIIGIDNKQRQEPINQPNGLSVDGIPIDILNDVTAGDYDITMEPGPSFQSRREEARQGMTDFIQAFPPAAPILAPVMADLQDWPNKDLVTKLLTTLAPQPVQAILAQHNNEPPPEPPPPPPPNPVEEAKAHAEIAKAQGEIARSQGIVAKAQFDLQDQALKIRQQELVNVKAEFDVLDAQMKLGANGPPLDSGKLHVWIGQVDMALRHLDQHAAAQLANMGQAGGQGGPQASAGQNGPGSPEGLSGAPPQGPDAQTGPPGAPEAPTPPALPPGHYAAMPEGGGPTP